jgi:hypothetical protein
VVFRGLTHVYTESKNIGSDSSQPQEPVQLTHNSKYKNNINKVSARQNLDNLINRGIFKKRTFTPFWKIYKVKNTTPSKNK